MGKALRSLGFCPGTDHGPMSYPWLADIRTGFELIVEAPGPRAPALTPRRHDGQQGPGPLLEYCDKGAERIDGVFDSRL